MLLAAGCLSGLISASASAAPVEAQKNGTASLFIDAPRDPDGFSIQLADILTITVQVDGVKLLTVKPPDRISKSPGWKLTAIEPAATSELAKDRQSWRQSYTFEPLAPGTLALNLEPFLASDNGGSDRKIVWRPLMIRVRTSITTPVLKDLRDPVIIEALPAPMETETTPWLAVGAGLLGIVLLPLAYRWWRRRLRPGAGRPEQRALRQLDRLLALHLPERGNSERFHTLLANVVRRYVEKKFHLPARRRTSREFIDLLETCATIVGPDQDFLRDLFTRCDLAKFAGADASAPECLALAAKARTFIQGINDSPHDPPPPPSQGADKPTETGCGQS